MQEIVHATSVAVAGRGLLIRGASGRGKSGLALDLMSRGAALIADDRTCLTRQGDIILLGCPPAIAGLIEARGLGLLAADPVADIPLAAILDLDTPETHRLPPIRMTRLLGVDLPLLHNFASQYFPASLMQYLIAGRRDNA